jgi:hypothetical protein
MVESNDATPDFKDRTVGLVAFGAVAVLIGAFCALLIPLAFLSVSLSKATVGADIDARSAWAAAAMYGVMAVALIWLGVGSIRARRWACELLLSLSWIWLLTGICALLVSFFVVPAAIGEAVSTSTIPPGMTMVVIVVTLGVVGLINVVLPGLFVLFYRSPHVLATCRARDPRPQWIDTCPRKLLTLTVVWALFAISVLTMPAYNFVFPLFGFMLTGVAGAVLWFLVLVVCGALALGTCRRAPWAWWGGVGLILAAAVSSVLSVLRYDLVEIMALMKMPEEQASMVAGLGLLNGWPMTLITALMWGTFLAYLLTLRKYFESASNESDG